MVGEVLPLYHPPRGPKVEWRINPDVFRKLVQVLLIVMGLQLILL